MRDTLTPAQEAIRMGMSLRMLRYIMKANPGLPVLRNGNRVLFDDKAHEALKDAMRVRPPAAPETGSAPPGDAPKQATDPAFRKLLELTAPKKKHPPNHKKKPK